MLEVDTLILRCEAEKMFVEIPTEDKKWKTLQHSTESLITSTSSPEMTNDSIDCQQFGLSWNDLKSLPHEETNLIDQNGNEMLPSGRSSLISTDERSNLKSLTTSNESLMKLEAIQKWYDSKLLESGIERIAGKDREWDISESINDWECFMRMNDPLGAIDILEDETRESEASLFSYSGFSSLSQLTLEYNSDKKTFSCSKMKITSERDSLLLKGSALKIQQIQKVSAVLFLLASTLLFLSSSQFLSFIRCTARHIEA
uniref:Uncharacterized protein n=1 Tax=Setaria digitata TaxID=48799 RepID=A0A915PDS3_9BILA